MKKVRTTTWIGLIIAFAGLMLISYDVRVALVVSVIGLALSIRNILTAE